MKPKKKKEQFALRVIKGGFAPADGLTATRLREKGYRINDVIFAELKKPRNPKFHNLAHQLGKLISENIEAFEGQDAHKVIKKLQVEANVRCEEITLDMPGLGLITYRIPESLSFENMDEGEFYNVIKGICRWVAEKYWPDLDEQQIASMAEAMVNET